MYQGTLYQDIWDEGLIDEESFVSETEIIRFVNTLFTCGEGTGLGVNFRATYIHKGLAEINQMDLKPMVEPLTKVDSIPIVDPI